MDNLETHGTFGRKKQDKDKQYENTTLKTKKILRATQSSK